MLRKIAVFLSVFSCLFFLQAGFAKAASLYFSPNSKQVSVGNILSVQVLVTTQGEPANNSQAVINFPSDMLEVVSLSKSGSIFSLWVEDPAFSNQSGTVSFNGGLPTPGYNGTAGNIITISFRAKAAGQASLYFSSGSVLANDGLGTEILKSTGQATFTLVGSAESKPAAVTEPVSSSPISQENKSVPKAPKITSDTNPNQDTWYNYSDPSFSWILEKGVTAAKLLYDSKPNSQPTITYSPAISGKELSGVSDGIYYLHVQVKNNQGWSPVSHFRFKIDTVKPDYFNVTEIPRDDKTNPVALFKFEANDKVSGIDRYAVQIDNGEAKVWQGASDGIFKTPALKPGRHSLIAKAIDQAGNYLIDSAEFNIQAILAPVITDYPQTIENGNTLILKGNTLPGGKISVYFRKTDDEPQRLETKSGEDGNFTLVVDKGLKEGVYAVWATVVDGRGAESGPSDEVKIVVKKSVLTQAGSGIISLMTIAIPAAGLIILMLLLLWYSWHKFKRLKRKIHKEAKITEATLHQAFQILGGNLSKQLALLERAKQLRDLTAEEKLLIKEMKKNLKGMEQFLIEEISGIEKQSK